MPDSVRLASLLLSLLLATGLAGPRATGQVATGQVATGQVATGPRLASVQPAPVVGSTVRQWITLRGEGFAQGFTVRLRAGTLVDAHVTDRARLDFVSDRVVRVRANVGTEAFTWSVQYVGPDSLAVSNTLLFDVAAPVPQIDEIRPAQKMAGDMGFDLAVYGRTLTEESQIRWNGEPYPTTPIYSSDNAEALTIGLRAHLPAAAIARAGDQRVTVYTPAPGGGVSAAHTLHVAARPLHLTPWFYLLCLAGVVVVGAGLHGLRMRHMREQVLERKVEQRTEQLRREKMKTEEQAAKLQQQAYQLRELDAAKSRFFANLSHEFRTPLTLILGPLQDLLGSTDRALGPDQKSQIERAVYHARHLQDLINQLLALARLESGQHAIECRPLDLVAFARDTVRSFQPWAEREQVALHFSTALARLALEADAEKLQRVLGNLLSNALKFTPAGGTVAVTVAEAGGEAVLQVRDTGVGISEDELPHIFDRFYQVSSRAKHQHESTGIGLALAKELVELHDGAIRAESALGEGTTLTVTLPSALLTVDAAGIAPPTETTRDDAAQGGDEPAGPALSSDGGTGGVTVTPSGAAASEASDEDVGDAATVLVVEDHADVRLYLRTQLTAAGYRIREARDGEEALDAIRAERPDLVVSDVMMPRMSGLELVSALRTDDALADLPVILLTARVGEDERVEGLRAGADDYVEKPFSADELEARIQSLVTSRATLRERYGRSITVGPTALDVTPEDEAYYERARAVVEAHVGDSAFDVAFFAQEMGTSKSTLGRKLKAATGCTPAAFVRKLRMERAAQLLAAGRNVSEAAHAVGYDSTEHFSRLFRAHHGTTPSAYPPGDEEASPSTPERRCPSPVA